MPSHCLFLNYLYTYHVKRFVYHILASSNIVNACVSLSIINSLIYHNRANYTLFWKSKEKIINLFKVINRMHFKLQSVPKITKTSLNDNKNQLMIFFENKNM